MKKSEAISILATSVRPREPKDKARYDKAVKMAIDALKESERKKRKWLMNGERYGHMYWRCSHCGEEVDYIGAKFCSNCGSYNGGEQSETD